MTPERWQHIDEIFQTAIELAPEERVPYVTDACTGDAELQRQVETLLTHYEAVGDSEDGPINEHRGTRALLSLENDADPMLGKRLGAYAIEREIGRGGMGAVYLASRADNVYQKQVAIKVVKRGMDTDLILRRFRHERQILANLDHPHIARLFDGGTTSDGLPYFVMEYIEGQPIYQYCDTRRLGVRERITLFCRVCEAVEYAHKNQVIHRDIKPSNILVNSAGFPKLFDFGIAKLLNPELVSDTAPQTATAVRLMTVEYASPEQVQGLPLTPLSDLYSLGVLLYELLTGHRPYRFRNRLLSEMARVISEVEPEYPSIVVSRSESLLTVVHVDQEAMTIGHLCEMRNETPESLRRELSGSLDNITLKTLSKEPVERYQSAAALRDDLECYLNGRPVSAPTYVPTSTRLLSKATHGNTQLQKSIAVLPFKLIGARQADDTGDDYLSIGLADALITRLSNVQRISVRPTSSVVRCELEDCDPLDAGRRLGVTHVLDGHIQRSGDRVRVTVQLINVNDDTPIWAHRFDEEFTDVLEIQDKISEQVAEALIPHLTGEERMKLAKRGTDNPDAFESYMRGRYYWNSMTEDGFAKSIACFERAVALDPKYAAAFAGIAEYHCWLAVYGLMEPAERLKKARDAAKRAIELDDTLADAHTAYGLALLGDEQQWTLAGQRFRRAIELNPNYSTAHVHYACQLAMEGRFDESIREAQFACEIDPLNPFNSYILAWNMYQARRYDEGLEQAEKLLQSDPLYGSAHFVMSWILRRMGRFDEALAESRKTISLQGSIPMFRATLASSLAERGDRDEAQRLLAEMNLQAETSFVSPYHRALIHVQLGEHGPALDLLEESVAKCEPWIVWLGVEPQLDRLRQEPRFISLLRKTSNPAAAHSFVSSKSDGDKSIAVLPFKLLGKVITEDTGEEFLGVGLADALITRLSNVRSLNVRPTSAILRYGDAGSDTRIAGRELGVEFVLDGRIRRAAERIRISLQLLNVVTGASIWARQFDEQFTDVLSLEDAISDQVAKALITHLTRDEHQQLRKRGTDNPEAFESYLRGRYFWNTFTVEGFAKALVCFNRAVAHAPDYALAYTGIADYYTWLGVYAVLPFKETSAAAKDAALKAVSLDNELAEAHSALGMATLSHDFDWKTSERHLRQAVELNPNNAPGRSWYCYFLGMSGRFDEAMSQVKRAVEIDPLTPIIHHTLNWTYFYARRYEEAIASTRRLIEQEPQYGLAYMVLCPALSQVGEYQESIEAGQKAISFLGRTPYTLTWLASAYAAAGKIEQANEVIEEIEQMSDTRYVSPYLLASALCKMENTERAYEQLEKALAIGDARLVWSWVDPQLDTIRSDQRFHEILRRINHPMANGVDPN
jgi:TolB-like protein/Tfp pilus assembly protein PilF/tRNA A-37 threonylcarbamoyl transferase component Bud32